MRRNLAAWTAIALSSVALISSQNWARVLPAAPQEAPDSADLANAKSLERAFEGIAEVVGPSVVQISVRQDPASDGGGLEGFRGLPPGQRNGRQMTPDEMRDFMEKFRRMMPEGFGLPGEGDEPRLERQQFQVEGTGSGFVFDDKGHILTNNHVVEGAKDGGIEVLLQDGTSLTAKVVGTDARTDVAVIKVDSDKLRPARIGQSEDLKVGQIVLAVGSPFGLEQTVTQGIISATHRNSVGILDRQTGFEDFVQTDAAINPGNSGGPLVNLDGEVIGINSAIATSRRAMNAGVGFAVPIDMAKYVANALIKEGKVTRALMGVNITELTPDLAEPLGLTGTKGILIQGVVPDSPAAKAGLERGDVLIAFNGEPVTSLADFRLDVATSDIDTPVEVSYVRAGDRKTAKVNLMPEEKVNVAVLARDRAPRRQPSEPAVRDDLKAFGLGLVDLTDENAEQFNFGPETRGILIRKVEADSSAATQGLQAGDLITGVLHDKKNSDVANVDELVKHVGKDAKEVAVYVQAPDGPGRFVALKAAD